MCAWCPDVCSSDLFFKEVGERLANRALVVDEQQVRDFDQERFAWHSAPSKGRCRTGVEEYPPGDRRAGYSPAGLGAVWCWALRCCQRAFICARTWATSAWSTRPSLLASIRSKCFAARAAPAASARSEEHTSEIQSLMRNSYAVFCLK